MSRSMPCPRCDGQNSRVYDSRTIDGGIRRRRECLECGFRWITREYAEEIYADVRRKGEPDDKQSDH